MEDEESAVRTWVSQKVNQRGLVLETDHPFKAIRFTMKLAEEEEIYNYKKQKAREIIKVTG